MADEEDLFVTAEELQEKMPPPRLVAPRPVVLPTFHLEDLQAALKDMEAPIPGIIPAGDLYRWYVDFAKEAKRQPVSQYAFGRALRGLQFRSLNRTIGGRSTRCWHLTRRVMTTDSAVSTGQDG